ncbi:MAG: XdhC family protein [Granulosicoccus sp.]
MKSSQQEVLEAASNWLAQGYVVELVTVVGTWGSSPRPLGSIAAIREDGVLSGSVSGGCVETQLSEQFRVRDMPQVHTHRIDDEHARRFGLACGGELELLFETLSDATVVDQLLLHIGRRERVVREVSSDTQKVTIELASDQDVFSWQAPQLRQVFGPAWQLLLIGAGELSRYTARFAKALDFDVLVVDPRDKFRANWDVDDVPVLDMSPDDAVLQYATDSRSAVLALSHDPNIDDLALMEALPSDAFHVGALGSARNYEKRCKRLVGLDVPSSSVNRLKGPVGISISARGSAEIAISIVAELIQVRQSLL